MLSNDGEMQGRECRICSAIYLVGEASASTESVNEKYLSMSRGETEITSNFGHIFSSLDCQYLILLFIHRRKNGTFSQQSTAFPTVPNFSTDLNSNFKLMLNRQSFFYSVLLIVVRGLEPLPESIVSAPNKDFTVASSLSTALVVIPFIRHRQHSIGFTQQIGRLQLLRVLDVVTGASVQGDRPPFRKALLTRQSVRTESFPDTDVC
jgi:hypothetical protein